MIKKLKKKIKPKHAITLLVCVYSHSTDKKCVITLLVCVYSHSADRKCAITLLVCVYHTALIKSVLSYFGVCSQLPSLLGGLLKAVLK